MDSRWSSSVFACAMTVARDSRLHRSSSRRLGLRRLLRIGWRTLRRVDLNARVRLFQFTARLWSDGLTVRLILIVMVTVVLAASSSATWRGSSATVRLLALSFSVCWSVGLAAAATLAPPVVFLLASAWLVFYHAQLSAPWLGTPVAVIAPAWVGWLAFRRFGSIDCRAAGLAGWVLAAAGLSYVTAGPSGLRRWLGWESTEARLLVWLVLATAGLFWFSRPWRTRPPGFAPVFWGGCALSLVVMLPGLMGDGAALGDSLQLVFADSAAIVVLFWLWTSGRATAGALRLAAWLLRYFSRLLPVEAVASGAPLVILIVLVSSRPGLATPEDPLLRALEMVRLWTGLSTVALLIWWRMTQGVTRARAIMAVACWWASVALLDGIRETSRSLIASHAEHLPLSGIAVALVAAGLVIELTGLSRHWSSAARPRVLGVLTVTTVTVASAVALSMRGNVWETDRLMTVIVGMLHFGVPLAVYETLMMHRGGLGGLDALAQIQLVTAGYAAGLLTVLAAPQSAELLVVDAAVVVAAVAVLRWHHPDLRVADGSFAGILFSSGLIAAWMHPQMPTIPFIPGIRLPVDVVVDKPLLSPRHLGILATAWAVGALVGAGMFAAWRRRD